MVLPGFPIAAPTSARTRYRRATLFLNASFGVRKAHSPNGEAFCGLIPRRLSGGSEWRSGTLVPDHYESKLHRREQVLGFIAKDVLEDSGRQRAAAAARGG